MLGLGSSKSKSNPKSRSDVDTHGYHPVYRQETAYMYDPTRDPARASTATRQGYGYGHNASPTAASHTVLQRDTSYAGRRGRSSLLHPTGSGSYRRDRSSSTSSSSSTSTSSDYDHRHRTSHGRRHRYPVTQQYPDYRLYHEAPRTFQSESERRRFIAQQEYERELRERRRRDEMYRGQSEQQQREQLAGHRGGGGGWGAKVAGMANRVTGTVTVRPFAVDIEAQFMMLIVVVSHKM
ncbi:hypothetical protein BCR44DRAFT_38470 [Catenaria anguillulae PL171]|uniref:Uncharacterized protein n=1 Tax=Catenaria anguillulae PL171 TaxID=765915 RepID=A0A1Y2HQ68_9FUNG|nr:hypothetical protein BCR44DRAFT_38470 [Catenaria anguillulae PL171]